MLSPLLASIGTELKATPNPPGVGILLNLFNHIGRHHSLSCQTRITSARVGM